RVDYPLCFIEAGDDDGDGHANWVNGGLADWEWRALQGQLHLLFTLRCSRLCVVESPIIVQEADFRLLLADEPLVLGAARQQFGVTGKELLARPDRRPVSADASIAARPVLPVPFENSGHFEPAGGRIVAVAGPVGEEAARLFLELCLEALGDVRLFPQHGAADRGAVDREMHARLVVGSRLSQRFVLDLIERERASEQRDKALLERVAGELAEV